MATAIGESKKIEDEKMIRLIGTNKKTICQELENRYQQDLIVFETQVIGRTTGTAQTQAMGKILQNWTM